MLPTIKAIFFDLDGTLAPLKHHHFHALNQALETFGYEPISYQDHREKYDGLPTKKKLVLLGVDPMSYKDIEEEKQTRTIKLIKEFCRPIPGQVKLFPALAEEGYILACCSNAKLETVQTALQRMETIKWFDKLMSNEDVASPKPHPEIYLKTMKKFWLKPEECLVLEDNHHGIESALKAGCHLMEVDNPYTINYTAIKKSIYQANLKNCANYLKGLFKL